MDVRDVSVAEKRREWNLDLRLADPLGRTGLGLAFELVDRFFEKLGVKLKAHGRDMPGLLRTQDVPSPADLKVVRGDAETA